ncbi:unnamed protein product [Arctia plantaginis]|uniref:Uncharacterized protein n=1 Tax=Arctia plantaginis TaxID=874455 RepID=A0A8S1AUC4_ARCPL|nr:unnamed protein product [Arctia plantaginis]CAB3250040.1 unnamed protein product [Arctia plantaginis]
METRRTQEGLTRGMLSRWLALKAGAWQGLRRGHSAWLVHTVRTVGGTLARGAATRLGRSTQCGADTACDRAHHSPSEAGLSARRWRAAGGSARAHQVYGYDRGRGRARLINQTSPIRTRYTGSPPPYSIFGAGHIFIIITPHIHKRHVIASKLTARGGRRPVGGADAR